MLKSFLTCMICTILNLFFCLSYTQFKGVSAEVEVDMSNPEDGRMSRAGQVLVDLATKRVY